MFLLLALGCNGTADVACPQWDHVVQLRACIVGRVPVTNRLATSMFGTIRWRGNHRYLVQLDGLPGVQVSLREENVV